MASQANILSFDSMKRHGTRSTAASSVHAQTRRGGAAAQSGSSVARATAVGAKTYIYRPTGWQADYDDFAPSSSSVSRQISQPEWASAPMRAASVRARRSDGLPSWMSVQDTQDTPRGTSARYDARGGSRYDARGTSARYDARGTSARYDARGTSRAAERVVRVESSRPRAGVQSYDEFLEEEGAEDQRTSASRTKKKSLSARFAEARKKKAKEKAGRQFTRQFGSDGASAGAENAGPRAAVYKGEMGASQRRANRMQDAGYAGYVGTAGSKVRGADSKKKKPSLIARCFSSKARLAAVSVVACVVLAGAFMYPAAKQYYTELRNYQQVQAEYDAVVARNAELAEQRDYLNSTEGIEQTAHDNYGWVSSGENAVLVYGLPSDDALADTNLYIATGSVPAPETWYSVILDPFFGLS